MIDLHIHTNCSDGSDDPTTVLKKAEELGLSHISITDHNNVNAYSKIDDNERDYGGKIITGVEPEGHYCGRIIELLGYNIDVEKMRGSLDGRYVSREEISKYQAEAVYKRLVDAGFKFSPDVLETLKTTRHYYPTCHYHEDLKKYPENRKLVTDDESWGNSIQFFRNHLGTATSPLYVDETINYPPIAKTCEWIKQADGLVFIPHVLLYGKDSLPFLNGLVDELDIDGVECYYPTHTKEQTEFLLDFCKKHKLMVSGGSDYHGSQRPNKLGSLLPQQKWFLKGNANNKPIDKSHAYTI